MSYFRKLRTICRAILLCILVGYIIKNERTSFNGQEFGIEKEVINIQLFPKRESRSDVLIASKAVFRNGVFYLNEQEQTIDHNVNQWNLGSHPGRGPLYASISFVKSLVPFYEFCKVQIDRPILLVKLVYWSQHGHTMFNVISNIYQTLKEMNLQDGEIRLYAAIDGPHAIHSSHEQTLNLGRYSPIFKAFTSEPVYNYYALLKNSFIQTFCFTNLVALGVSKQLDHYTTGIPLERWRMFSRWILNVFHIQATIRNSDAQSLEDTIVVTMIERTNRRILNLAELKTVSAKRWKTSVVFQIIDFSIISLEEQLKYMRNTTILFGIDGTALMSSLFMLNRCGYIIHIGTYMMRTFITNKGMNFRPLFEAGTGENRHIYSEIQNITDISMTQRSRYEHVSAMNLTIAERFSLAVDQDVHLPVSQYLNLLEQAMYSVRLCLDNLKKNNV